MGPSLVPPWLGTAATGGSEGMGFSDSAGSSKLYGAMLDRQLAEEEQAKRSLKRRRRLNCLPALLSALLPWVMFVATYSMSAFYAHYSAPVLTTFALSVTVASCSLATLFLGRSKSRTPEAQFYPLYLAAALTVAAASGWAFGDYSFWRFSHLVYRAEHLGTYSNVDPSSERMPSGEVVPTRGVRYQDAGKVYFERHVTVDTQRYTSFKMGDLYCAAPIVNPKCRRNCGLDFWAVGVNCCSEDGSYFGCGQVNNTHARSGLRLLDDGLRPMFRLAVLQAESGGKVPSLHPVFFQWLQDPVAEIRLLERQGYGRLLVAMCLAFPTSSGLFWLVAKSRGLL